MNLIILTENQRHNQFKKNWTKFLECRIQVAFSLFAGASKFTWYALKTSSNSSLIWLLNKHS